MPLAKESLILGLSDAKIFELDTDTSATLKYKAAVDVPGITTLNLNPVFDEKELRGDDTILDHRTKLVAVDWSFENVMLSLDALAILQGGKVKSGGTTPAQTQTYTILNTDNAKYFKLEAKSDYADVGDVHYVLYKAKANSVSVSLVGEDYAKVSASGKAIGTVKDKKIQEIIFNETAVAIS